MSIARFDDNSVTSTGTLPSGPSVAACHILGAAAGRGNERLLETAAAYARTGSQFGQATGKFQAVSHRVADTKVQLEAARLLTYRAASRLGVSRSVSMDAAITKLFVSESLVKAALDTIQLHGGNGFMVEYEVERALRDAVGATLY